MRNHLPLLLASFVTGLGWLDTFVVTDRVTQLFVVTDRGQAELVQAIVEPRLKAKMYTATWCGYCGPAKDSWVAYAKKNKVPFDLEYVDVTNGGHPDWCTQLPAYSWEVNGQTRYVMGYPGAAKLIQRWEWSQPAKAAAQPRAPP